MYAIDKVKNELVIALKSAFGKDYSPNVSELEIPKITAHGDFAFPCFRLAKGLKRNPAEIAAEYAPKIMPKGMIKEAKAIGPYINFTVNPDELVAQLIPQIATAKEKYGTAPGEARTVMVEYSGFNTLKPVHIGHTRNVLLGAALVRLMRASGIKVIAADFVNDLGLHVAQWLWNYQKSHAKEQPPKEAAGKWLGDLYTEAVLRAEETEENKAQVQEMLKKLEKKDRSVWALWKKSRTWSLKEFAKVHKELGAKFDVFYAESDVADDRLPMVEELKQKGIAEISQGATIVNLEDEKLGVFLILRSDGTALYATTDLPLAMKKFRDFPQLDASIYITDTRQKQHFAQLFATLKRAGVQQEFQHIGYEFVTLPEGAMSSRKGTIIAYESLRDAMVEKAEEETKKRHPEWPEKKLKQTAQKIAMAALKFEMLKQDPEKKITFVMEDALSFDGFSAPYLLYMSARIQSMLGKAGKAPRKNPAPLTAPAERQLLMDMLKYPEVVKEAAQTKNPAHIAQFLYGFAQDFSRFYAEVPVAQATDAEKALHIPVVHAAKTVLIAGLTMLGIEAVDEM